MTSRGEDAWHHVRRVLHVDEQLEERRVRHPAYALRDLRPVLVSRMTASNGNPPDDVDRSGSIFLTTGAVPVLRALPCRDELAVQRRHVVCPVFDSLCAASLSGYIASSQWPRPHDARGEDGAYEVAFFGFAVRAAIAPMVVLVVYASIAGRAAIVARHGGGEIRFGLEAETTGGFCLPQAQLRSPGSRRRPRLYDTLTAPNTKGDYIPNLAESVTPNADFTEWTIKLRGGITFHDGEPLNVDAVIQNLRRLEEGSALPVHIQQHGRCHQG